MPELPEVETVRRGLSRWVVGRTIGTVDVLHPRSVRRHVAGGSDFAAVLAGRTITGVNRRGKYILVALDNDQVLVVHLRMTGKFISVGLDNELPPYSHVVFHLDNDRRLVFSDMRQFGRMRLLSGKALSELAQIAALAPEPLLDEFTPEYLFTTLQKSRRSLKQLLLDQTKILGLGNIYASEALFLARISPFKSTDTLSRKRALALYAAIRDVLGEAIEAGSTLKIDLDDQNGSYFGSDERFWRVYERAGEPCVNCGTKIRRAVQGGRSTYYCPKCQRR